MPVDSNRRSRRRICLSCIAVTIFGLCVFYLGYQGLSQGSIAVSFKNGDHLVAYANGPHAEYFAFEVWSRMIVGGGLAMLGVLSLLLWVFGGPTRRERALVAVEAMRSRHMRVPGWLAFLVISAFVSVCLYAGFAYRR